MTNPPRVAVIGGCRSPFVRAGGAFAKASFLDLGMHVVTSAVKKLNLDPAKINELAFSTVLLDPRLPNFAREIVIRSDLPDTLSAHSISNNCISGLVAISFIADGIRAGRIENGLAGGSESMSRPTLTLKPEAEKFFIGLSRAKGFGQMAKMALNYRPSFAFPVPPSPKEPSTGLTMGQHCELTTKELQISREAQDKIALASHLNAARAQGDGFLAQDIASYLGVEADNLIRKDTSGERLAKLPPVFDRSGSGSITAGNSSALTDGASAVYLMSEEAARREGREILGFIERVEFTAISPKDGLLMAPAFALPNLLQKGAPSIDGGRALRVADIDCFEIHEAFGAQVAANLQVWEQGWNKFPQLAAIGKIPEEKINVNGGSIAIGHPFAATGGRILLAMVNQLQKSGGRLGVISICAAGAMAGAMLISRE